MARRYQLILSPQAQRDIQFWGKSDRSKLERIARLLEAIVESPFDGIGRPKELRHEFQGAWSRRIDGTHRIIYEVDGPTIAILSLRGHYGDS